MLTPDSAATFGRLAANHLWQSTGFAAVIALLALAVKGSHARVRHRLWLVASVKFLIPFSVLTSIGGILGRWLVPAPPMSQLPLVMEQIVQPFAPIPPVGLSVEPIVQAPAASSVLLPALLVALWLCGFIAVSLYGCVRWRRVAAAVRSSSPIRQGPGTGSLAPDRVALLRPAAPRLLDCRTGARHVRHLPAGYLAPRRHRGPPR